MNMKEAIVKNFIQRHKGKSVFLEHEVKGLLKEIGLSVPKGEFFASEKIPPSFDLKFPLVAKVSSSAITSKSDVKGVKVGINDAEELGEALHELFRIEHAEGALVEETAPQGLEVIVGGIIDNQFGPIVMFGLGGIFVELFNDVAFGLAPLTVEEAFRLITQVKGYKLIEGYRGKPALDKQTLTKIVVAVSELMATGIIEEIDLNPVALYPEGAITLDAKMRIFS